MRLPQFPSTSDRLRLHEFGRWPGQLAIGNREVPEDIAQPVAEARTHLLEMLVPLGNARSRSCPIPLA